MMRYIIFIFKKRRLPEKKTFPAYKAMQCNVVNLVIQSAYTHHTILIHHAQTS